MINKEEELVAYLSKASFDRFIQCWIKKYYSLGYLGGSIRLCDLNEEEKEALGAFLGMDLSSGSLKITYNQLIKKLKETIYEDVDFLEVLNRLNGEVLLSKKEIKKQKQSLYHKFVNSIKDEFKNSEAMEWLNDYFFRENYSTYIDQDYEEFYDSLRNVCNAYNHFPIRYQKHQLLAIFAQEMTRNPHYFDDDFHRDLLLKSLCFYSGNDLADKNALLLQGGLIRDELSNYCYICHLLPIDTSPLWQSLYDDYEPWNMNMYNLHHIKEGFYPQKIFVFENPSVFFEICQYILKENRNIGVICSNGQINQCTYLLLDKLAKSRCFFYYAGDFDPEGLLIADKLKQRYQNSLSLIGYDIKLFDQIIYSSKQGLTRRYQMLKQLQDKKLQLIAKRIIETKSFAYQEGLIKEYKEIIRKICEIDD